VDCLSDFFRTAVTKNGELIELLVEEKEKNFSVGSVYAGVVKKILPSQFAFIDIGDSRNAFLQINDFKEKAIYKYNQNKKQNELSIKCGQEIIVQIVKDGSDIKAPVVSSMISLSGKYVVLLFNDIGVNISKKIDDEKKRERFFQIGEKIVSQNPDKLGVIMRTNCVDADEKVIIDEAQKLIEKYNAIIKKGNYLKAPACIYEAENETNRVINDLIKNDTDEIIINEIGQYNKFIDQYSGNGKVIFYDGNVPMFDNFFIESQIEKALHNKIWLKSGGFLIFDYTEAGVFIDVNTGKYSKGSYRKTVFNTNIEAAKEVAKQIRLRNLSGMILIDFVDMKFSEDRESVINLIYNEVKKDRVGVNILGMTELGILQLTRKKVRQPIYKALTCKCPYCGGGGLIYNERFIADKIRNQVCSVFSSTIYNKVIISSNQRVINAFKGKNNDYKTIEEKFGKRIDFNVIATQKLDYYKLDKFKSY